jgi:hypothetical protein
MLSRHFVSRITLVIGVFLSVLSLSAFSQDKAGQGAKSGSAKPAVVAKADASARKDTLVPIAVTLKPQETCPIMGEPINKKFYVDYQGKRIYACCGMCPDKIKQDPEKYIKKLASMGEGVETIAPPAAKPAKAQAMPADMPKGMKMESGK